MSNKKTHRLHNLVQTAYDNVQTWLQRFPEIGLRYKLLKYDEIKRLIYNARPEERFLAAVAQFYTYMPIHSFKVQAVLDDCISKNQLDSTKFASSPMLVLDVGCGTGTATIALINYLLQEDLLPIGKKIIYIVAADPDEYALRIYEKLLDEISLLLQRQNIPIEIHYQVVTLGLPEAVTEIVQTAGDLFIAAQESLKLPYFPLALGIQANIFPPLESIYLDYLADRQRLVNFGLSDETLPVRTHAHSLGSLYRQIFHNVPIDELAILTIGTEGFETKVKLVARTIRLQFTKANLRSTVTHDWSDGFKRTVTFENAKNSFFNSSSRTTYFYADVCAITQLDETWKRLIDIDNLRLAWSRSRRALLRESLADELEIRLFEYDQNLEKNLYALREQLIAYAQEVARTELRMPYPFPKKSNVVRPRILSSIEEDVISVAIAQVLAQQFNGDFSYDYLIEPNRSEFLFEYYLQSYKRYIDDIRNEVERQKTTYPKAIVIQTDVKSFYKNIIQTRLVENELGEHLSNRVKWLLGVFLTKKLPSIEDIAETKHEDGKGITQGGTASGYYAKYYLKSLHRPFLATKKQIRLFRYADDMTVVIPNANDKEEVWNEIVARLKELGLDASDDKTHPFSVEEYLGNIELYEVSELEILGNTIRQQILRPLYLCPTRYRKIFQNSFDSEEWWINIHRYHLCLKELGIFISVEYLSRKISEYLKSNPKIKPVEFPGISLFTSKFNSEKWASIFRRKNQTWYSSLEILRQELRNKLRDRFEAYLQAVGTGDKNLAKWHRTYTRFLLNRIAVLGFGDLAPLVVEMIQTPGLISSHHWIMEQLARQGYTELLLNYLEELESGNYGKTGYLRAICLRAIRFLPDITIYEDRVNAILSKELLKGKAAEQLMAAETLLKLNILPQIDLEQIRVMLRNTEISQLKLARSFVLLLSKYSTVDLTEYPIYLEHPYLFDDAYEITNSNRLESLFSYYEPMILRQKSYADNYPDFEGDVNNEPTL